MRAVPLVIRRVSRPSVAHRLVQTTSSAFAHRQGPLAALSAVDISSRTFAFGAAATNRGTTTWFSTAASDHEQVSDPDGPSGELFGSSKEIGPSLVGKTASIRRTFGPRSNSEAMLTCGGKALAAHASFDPDYRRAKGWIRHHAVGPAVLSPVLISGLVGALVEAAFPESVPDEQSIKVLMPLIVGVEINATIEVVDVIDSRRKQGSESERDLGYKVKLDTKVTRVRDDTLIAKGEHTIFIPDYMRM